jgi:DNA helicase-2/ATP-dependent DNA helicase PcrA
MDTEYLHKNCNEVQRQAIISNEGPQLLLAAAGSGKTRVLTFKIAWLIDHHAVLPEQIMAVTFTNKAAEEMRTRVMKIVNSCPDLRWLGTFHSVCARLLHIHGKRLGYQDNFSIYDKEDQKSFIKKLLKAEKEEKITSEAFQNRINQYKHRNILPDEVRKNAEDRDEERIGYLYYRYQAELAQNNAMDFGDLICQAFRLLKQHPEVKTKFNIDIRYILIDEFQDTNKAQFELIKLLLGPHNNITVVGDEDQSIYGWRGADITNILSFKKYFTGANVIKMEQNYRSTGNIIGLASSVIRNNKERLGKNMWTANEAGKKVTLNAGEDENEEAKWVIGDIEKSSDFSLSQTAVFYRTNAQSRVFEDHLRRCKIPYVVYGGIRFYDRKEVKDILAYLRILCNPKDSVSLGRIINVPKRGIGNKTLEYFADMALEKNISLFEALNIAVKTASDKAKKIVPFLDLYAVLKQAVHDEKVRDIVEMIIEQTGYHLYLENSESDDADDRLSNVAELISAAGDFEMRNPGKGLDEFLQEISLFTQEDDIKEQHETVTLMTVHSAKGLEFPRVYLTGLEEGLFPLLRDPNRDKLEEERRLFYVAATRAQKELKLIFAHSRRIWGHSNMTKPSRFIGEADRRFLSGLSNLKNDRNTVKSGRYYEPLDGEFLPDYEDEISENEFWPGLKIYHKDFGQGKILKTEGFGDAARILVAFQDGIPRKIIPKYAKLTVLD